MHGVPPPLPCAAALPRLPLPGGVPRVWQSPFVQLHDHSVVFPKDRKLSAEPTGHCRHASSPRVCILARAVCLRVQEFRRPDTIPVAPLAAVSLAWQPYKRKVARPVLSFLHLQRLACSTLVCAQTEGSSIVSITSSRAQCRRVGNVGFPWLAWANSPESLLAPEVEKPLKSSPTLNRNGHGTQTSLSQFIPGVF